MASSAPRYARAFAEVVQASRLDVPATQQQLRDFADALTSSSELRSFLENPSVEMSKKLKVMDALAARIEMFPQVRNFIAVILEHQRLEEFHEILTQYDEVVNQNAGAVEARVISAHPMGGQDRAEMESQIAKLAGARVRATYSEDPSLLGGAIVEIGSTVYDGSIRTQLQQLRQRMVNA